MLEVIELFGTSVTVPDMKKTSQFYQQMIPHNEVKQGVFAGINYIALLHGGEVALCVFEESDGNPLEKSFPTYRVASVDSSLKEFEATGGSVILPLSECPCTQAPFAICVDRDGQQFMIKEARAQ